MTALLLCFFWSCRSSIDDQIRVHVFILYLLFGLFCHFHILINGGIPLAFFISTLQGLQLELLIWDFTNLWKNWIWVLSFLFLYPRTVLSELIVMIYFKKGSIDTPWTIFLWPSNVWILENLPWEALQRMAVPSTEQETKQLESLAQQMSIMSPTCPRSWRGWPHWTVSSCFPNSAGRSFRDHTTTIWSSEPVAKNCPLGENLTTFTVEVCPLCRS